MGSQHVDPPASAPPGLWTRPEMASALASRDMGAVILIFRRWTGASQTDISARVGMPQSHISDLEHGKRRVTALEVFERVADGLGIPRILLGLTDVRASNGGHSSPSGGGHNYRLAETVGTPAAESHRGWLHTRRLMNQHRFELTKVVTELYPVESRLGQTGILVPDAWRVPHPIDIGKVTLTWLDDPPAPAVTGRQAETRALRPLDSQGRLYGSYHRAIRDLDRPRLFENRLCYRLVDVTTDDREGISLALGNMSYFDMIDVGEALAHEAALAGLDPSGAIVRERISWSRLPFRRLTRDPFALGTYPLMLSVSTLTIRESRAGATFYMLRRSPAKVAIAGGMLSVFPTGVFQPASIVPAPESPDFNLWRNIMREYSEEYLGNPEHDGDGQPIDYANQEPFRSFDEARRSGKIRVYCVGLGIDALNYVGDVLTVAVFDAEAFDAVFRDMVQLNDEGEVATDGDQEAFTFDRQTIQRLLANEPLAPSGAACLHLAWQHHAAILTNP